MNALRSILILALLLTPLAAKASLTVGGTLYFTGFVYADTSKLDSGRIRILANAGAISNLNTSRASGRYRYALIMSPGTLSVSNQPYFVIASLELPALPPGGKQDAINSEVDYHPPPDGDYKYYVALLEEEPGCEPAQFCLDDYGTGPAIAQFRSGQLTTVQTSEKPLVEAVEFHHADFDHYFISTERGEIALIDLGQIAGWQRTGQTFKVWRSLLGEGLAVCRFFSVGFSPKSTHFFTPYGAECDQLRQNPRWVDELVTFYVMFATYYPGGDDCPSSLVEVPLVPLFRLYNNGKGGAPAHRFTTSLAVREVMVQQGWIPEGAGPLGIIACVSP